MQHQWMVYLHPIYDHVESSGRLPGCVLYVDRRGVQLGLDLAIELLVLTVVVEEVRWMARWRRSC